MIKSLLYYDCTYTQWYLSVNYTSKMDEIDNTAMFICVQLIESGLEECKTQVLYGCLKTTQSSQLDMQRTVQSTIKQQ